MKHARPDYNRIQDPAGLIGEDEPVFLIRAKDFAAPVSVRAWAQEAQVQGAAPNIVRAALEQADAMEAWQRDHGGQVPDMPE